MTPIPDDHEAARALRDEFDRLGREHGHATPAPLARAHRRSRALLATLAIGLGAGAVAVAGSQLLDGQTSGDHRSVGDRDAPAPADAKLSEVRRPDPSGGLAWGLRIYTSKLGLPCVMVGRVKDRRLGSEDNGRLLAYPPDAPGLCATSQADHAAFSVRRTATPAPGRTVIYGVVDRSVSSVIIHPRPGRSRPVPVADDGGFLLVESGPEALRSATITLTVAGVKRTSRLG
ncbi:MAG: hypothetical protein ACJ762_06425 [Solirubrobacteraceae bacterium]